MESPTLRQVTWLRAPCVPFLIFCIDNLPGVSSSGLNNFERREGLGSTHGRGSPERVEEVNDREAVEWRHLDDERLLDALSDGQQQEDGVERRQEDLLANL